MWNSTRPTPAPRRLSQGSARVARLVYAIVCAVVGVAAWLAIDAQTQQSHGLSIPAAHPRLWFDASRLAQARTWHQTHPFTPAADNPLDSALLSVLTGQGSHCRPAINWAMGITIPDVATTNSSNEARWFGEQVYLTWDWCHAHMSAAERQTLLDRWNSYNDQLRQKPWGGPTMNANNYHWGYLRNELAWAIASYGESASADTFLQDALVTRWANNFVPYAAGAGAGGVATEGSQDGPYLLGYGAVPFQAMGMYGRSIYNETSFHRAAVFSLIYGMAPGISTHRGSSVQSGYETFPYSDDESWRHGRSAHDVDYGTFMTVAAMQWGNTAVGRYARQWLNTVQPARHRFVQAVDTGGPAEGFSSLPPDYYAAGPGRLFTRTSWDSNATAIHLMLGDDTPATGHSQDDWGFQIWRGGRWLSRETTAYSEHVNGYAGGARDVVTSVLAHNGILMNGTYVSPNTYRSGPPRVVRLQSTDSFSYAAANLGPAYRAVNRPQNDNPAVGGVVREFLFVRPFETLVILDRLSSNAVGSTPAANITKAFLTHFENNPQIASGNSVLGVNGSQALRLITLVPSNPVYRVIDEAGNGGTAAIAQYRLEVETSGEAQSYFLHVLQARNSSGADISASVTEDASMFRRRRAVTPEPRHRRPGLQQRHDVDRRLDRLRGWRSSASRHRRSDGSDHGQRAGLGRTDGRWRSACDPFRRESCALERFSYP